MFQNNYNCKMAVENNIIDVNLKDQENSLKYLRSDQNINKTPTSDSNKNPIDTIHCESDRQTKCLSESNELPTPASEMVVSGVMDLNVKDKEAIPIYEKLPSDSNASEVETHKSELEETNTGKSSSTSDLSDQKQDVDVDIVNSNADIFDENQVSHNVDQNTDINDNLLQQEKLVGTENAMSAEKEKSKFRYNEEMEVLSNSEYQQNSNDLVHSFGLELNTLDSVSKTAAVNSKYFNIPITGTVKKVETSKTEAGTLQDPQVSSGCNQSVQTDRILSIDVASSPFVGHVSPTSTKSIGIQCNFDTAESNNNVFAKDSSLGTYDCVKPIGTIGSTQSKVPKLGSLANTGSTQSKVPKLGSLANTGSTQSKVPKLGSLANTGSTQSKVPKLGSLANTGSTQSKVPKLGSLANTGSTQSKVPKLGSLATTLLGSNYWQGMGLVSFINRNLRGSSTTKESIISEKLPEEGSYKHATDMKTAAKEIKLEKSDEYNSDVVADQDTKC